MMLGQVAGWLILALLVWAIVSARRQRGRRRGGGVGTAASGALYELLSEDKRRAIELIVEQRAEERDPERADGNLPELERPAGRAEPVR